MLRPAAPEAIGLSTIADVRRAAQDSGAVVMLDYAEITVESLAALSQSEQVAVTWQERGHCRSGGRCKTVIVTRRGREGRTGHASPDNVVVLGSPFGPQRAEKAENFPTVQSAFDGRYYVRSVPSEAIGDKGKTQVFAVKHGEDELLDEYPVYMRGELFLAWSPSSGQWSLVHLELARVWSEFDIDDMGKVSRLAFYLGGRLIADHSPEELRQLGLERRVTHLGNQRIGHFTVLGIEQVASTNRYVFVMETINRLGRAERIRLDITTGKAFVGGPGGQSFRDSPTAQGSGRESWGTTSTMPRRNPSASPVDTGRPPISTTWLIKPPVALHWAPG